jgi:hypothetical protein
MNKTRGQKFRDTVPLILKLPKKENINRSIFSGRENVIKSKRILLIIMMIHVYCISFVPEVQKHNTTSLNKVVKKKRYKFCKFPGQEIWWDDLNSNEV